jgi:predicted DNA-binding transcriptional regulator AlpA
MFITDLVTITELSRLTKRSRPTIYKYINDYLCGNYDDIPFSFLKLFQLSSNCSKSDIEHYCRITYGEDATRGIDMETQELIDLIVKSRSQIDIAKIKSFILKEIENDR